MLHNCLINRVELLNKGHRSSVRLRIKNGRSALETGTLNASRFVKGLRVRDNPSTGSSAREQRLDFGP